MKPCGWHCVGDQGGQALGGDLEWALQGWKGRPEHEGWEEALQIVEKAKENQRGS